MVARKVRLKGSVKKTEGIKDSPFPFGEEYRRKFGQLKELSSEQEEKIKRFCRRELKEYDQDTSTLQLNLRRWNDLSEGVTEERTPPFDGAEMRHVGIPRIYLKIYKSVQKRSILGADNIWYMETEPGSEDDDEEFKEAVPDIEQSVNYLAREKWGVEEGLSSVFHATNRDGVGIMQVPYVEEYKPKEDFVIVRNFGEFLAEFATPDDLGVSLKEWGKVARKVKDEASEETPIEIPIEYEEEIYRGPKYEVVDWADFRIFPAHAKDFESARGYGKEFGLRKGLVMKKGKDKLWYEKAVSDFKKFSRRSGSKSTPYQDNQDWIEGINRSGKSDDWRFQELVIRIELKKGKGEQELLVTYFKEGDVLMACIDYPYRINFYARFRIEPRTNRFSGIGLMEDTWELSEEIDDQHNQRVNSRKIAEVPTFKGQSDMKRDYDRSQYEWAPGAIFWLKHPEKFEQFKVQPSDLGQSLQEEANDMRILDLKLGSSAALLSGRAEPSDPNAPGNKTADLISQSSLRMDDPLSELRLGVEAVGDITVSHMYQFGANEIPFKRTLPDGTKETSYLPRRVLRTGIRARMEGITVTDNPDAELVKWLGYYRVLVAEPFIGQDGERRTEILRTGLRRGRVPNRNKILPTIKEIRQKEIQLRAQAMLLLQQQKAQEGGDAEGAALDNEKKRIQIEGERGKQAAAIVGEGLGS